MEFDRDYQQHLVARLFRRKFLADVAEKIESELFDTDLAEVVETVLDFWTRYKKPPSRAQVQRHIGHELPHLPQGGGPSEFDLDEIGRFIQYRGWREALITCHELLQIEDYDSITTTLDKAKRLGVDHKRIIDVESLIQESLLTRTGGARFGLESFDEATSGVCAGEVALVMAPTGSGKSTWCVWVGSLALNDGMSVLHISTELPKPAMMQKYEPRIGKWLKRKKKRGNLHLMCVSPYSISPQGIRADILRMTKTPDLIILDSLDQIKSDRRFNSRWEEDEQMAVDMAAIAKDFGCRMWQSCQFNRPGYGQAARLDKIKGSLARVQLPNHVIAITQEEGTIEDPETSISIIRLVLLKNTFGPHGLEMPVEVDWKKNSFKEIEFV